MNYLIGFWYLDGSVYIQKQNLGYWEGDEVEGEWTSPFPNTMNDSFAYGQEESIRQSSVGYELRELHGPITKIRAWHDREETGG